MSEERRQPWERQDWETATAFARFQCFFLPQEQPRSVVEAYRRYRRSKGATEEQVARIKQVPGTWFRWAYAKDKDGNPIPGAQTWAERAQAYDDHMAALAVQAEEAERRRILSQRFALQHKRVEALDALRVGTSSSATTPSRVARRRKAPSTARSSGSGSTTTCTRGASQARRFVS